VHGKAWLMVEDHAVIQQYLSFTAFNRNGCSAYLSASS